MSASATRGGHKNVIDLMNRLFDFSAGHTHGGQLFPMIIFAYLVNPFFAGLYRYREGHVYVTQGAVYWGIPMRMFSEAEITRVILRSA